MPDVFPPAPAAFELGEQVLFSPDAPLPFRADAGRLFTVTDLTEDGVTVQALTLDAPDFITMTLTVTVPHALCSVLVASPVWPGLAALWPERFRVTPPHGAQPGRLEVSEVCGSDGAGFRFASALTEGELAGHTPAQDQMIEAALRVALTDLGWPWTLDYDLAYYTAALDALLAHTGKWTPLLASAATAGTGQTAAVAVARALRVALELEVQFSEGAPA